MPSLGGRSAEAGRQLSTPPGGAGAVGPSSLKGGGEARPPRARPRGRAARSSHQGHQQHPSHPQSRPEREREGQTPRGLCALTPLRLGAGGQTPARRWPSGFREGRGHRGEASPVTCAHS